MRKAASHPSSPVRPINAGQLANATGGQSSGKRQHGTVQITKEWDANTPMIFQALTDKS